MKRISRRGWVVALVAAVVVAGMLALAWNSLRRPQPLGYPFDFTELGAPLRVVTVYYPVPDSLALALVVRHTRAGGTAQDLARQLVTFLAEPHDSTRAVLPRGTRLLHFFREDDGECVLDFNVRVEAVRAAGIRRERLLLDALVRTMAENLGGVTRLRLLVEGRPLRRWGAHLRPGPVVEVSS